MNFSNSSQKPFDIAVVGGGLLGTAIARDAAQRGLSVVLFEADDFGAGAVARGSGLALGGLSAVGTLDFTPVREDIREREILLQTLGPLALPQTCLVPFYNTHGLLAQARLRAGLALSDALGFDHALRVHQLLSVRETKKRAPGLRPDGLLGAALVWEAVVPSIPSLARALALDARSHSAVLHSQTSVTDLRRTPGRTGRERVEGVRWKDTLSGETGETPASLTILAAGAGASGLTGRPAGRRVKTISVLGPPLPGRDALILPLDDPPALLAAIPTPSGCWAGSLALPYTDGDAPYVTGPEASALVSALGAYLPGHALSEVREAQAAIHTVAASGQEVEDLGDGLVMASGAGITRFRRVAEEAVDLACRKLGRALSVPPCRTASTPLPPLPVCPDDSLEAAAKCAVADEDCRTLRDFLARRLPPGRLEAGSVEERQALMPAALESLSALLGWDEARRAAEVKAWEAERALGQTFRVL